MKKQSIAGTGSLPVSICLAASRRKPEVVTVVIYERNGFVCQRKYRSGRHGTFKADRKDGQKQTLKIKKAGGSANLSDPATDIL